MTSKQCMLKQNQNIFLPSHLLLPVGYRLKIEFCILNKNGQS